MRIGLISLAMIVRVTIKLSMTSKADWGYKK